MLGRYGDKSVATKHFELNYGAVLTLTFRNISKHDFSTAKRLLFGRNALFTQKNIIKVEKNIM